MTEDTYGWNVQMQLRPAAGLLCREIPVAHRCRRGGRSKVSGDLAASLSAAWKIATTFLRLAWRQPADAKPADAKPADAEGRSAQTMVRR